MTALREESGVLWWDRIAFIPSIHGRAAFAREVRKAFLGGRFPTVAVELPESLADRTLEGIGRLPGISVVSYEEPSGERAFFPIDPCDSIVEALRLGIGENCALEFIDRDVEEFRRLDVVLPDPYAMTSIGLPAFYSAVEGALPAIEEGSQDDLRERHMARRLRRLLDGPRRSLPVLCVTGIVHLRGIAARLDAMARSGPEAVDEGDDGPPPVPPLQVDLHDLTEGSLYHVLGELPYTTHLWEEERGSITLDEFEATDKLKLLLLRARERYHEKHTAEYEQVSLASFQNLLRLIRNLSLLGKRLTPSLYEMALAAKGIGGSEFAVRVIETAKRYPPMSPEVDLPDPAGEGSREEPDRRGPGKRRPSRGGPSGEEAAGDSSGGGDPDEDGGEAGPVDMTEEAMKIGDATARAKKRYIDEAKVWRKLRLEKPPPSWKLERWKTAWNPRETCSWTPEDVLVENFAGHVRSRALLESGIAEERLEEFRTSFKDGIHVRETIRNLHLGKIIVRELPQIRGQVGAVVIIYEPPDRDRFPWRITWFPEYEWESILALYATDYRKELVGPGIARATYGGQLFLRTWKVVRDIWTDPRLDEARDDAERLLFGAARNGPERFIAYVAGAPPTARMKEYAAREGKRIIYLPLSGFSRSTIERLRRFHVLNGKPVRSWARQFIR